MPAPLNAEAANGAHDGDLVALRLLSHDGHPALEILQQLQETLAQIQVECKIAECEGQPCLLIQRGDESATNCCLKNQGVAIAETLTVTEARSRPARRPAADAYTLLRAR